MISLSKFRKLLKPFQSWYDFTIALSLLPGLIYLPIWLRLIAKRIFMGSASVALNICFIALGLYLIFEQKDELKKYTADDEDRFVGYALVFGSVIMYGLFFNVSYLQAITCATALIGTLLLIFGNRFVRKFALAVSMIGLGLLPKYHGLGYLTSDIFLPHNALGQFMALVSGSILQLIGQPATVHGQILQLGTGAVDVADGCSGYNMAVTLAGTGFVMGIFYKLKPIKVVFLMLAGAITALVINVPRIILLTYAVIYWGDDSFKFWHGGWGSQIVAGIMFTIFYYVSMAICKRGSITA